MKSRVAILSGPTDMPARTTNPACGAGSGAIA